MRAIGSNPLEPTGQAVSDGLTGRITDPVSGNGLFNPNTDPNVVGIDPLTGTDAVSGTDVGFGSAVRGRIDRGLYNPEFALPPVDSTRPIVSDQSSADYNPLPFWNLVNVSGSSVTATWASGAVTLDLGVGSAGDDGAVEQLHAVNRSEYQGWAYVITGYVSASSGASANAYLEGQFLTETGATTGSAVRTEADSGAFTVVMGATPTNAVYLRVRLGIERDALAADATASRTWTEAGVSAGPPALYLSNYSTTAASITAAGYGWFELRTQAGSGGKVQIEDSVDRESPIRVLNGSSALIGAVPIGLAPYAYPIGLDSGATSGGGVSLDTVVAGSGGARAIPILVPSIMLLESVTIWNTDTANLRTAEWALFWDQAEASSNNLVNWASPLLGAALGTFSFTPGGAASVQTSSASGAPVRIPPGLYWLVIRNTSTARTFGLGFQSAGTLAAPRHRFTAAASALTVTLDISGWTDSNAMPLVRLDGRIGSEAAAF